jgi:hypothetical protein
LQNFSQWAKQHEATTGQNLPDQFLEEAKALWEREQGRATIANVVALILTYIAAAITGKDRPALMYRYTAYVLLDQLALEKKYHMLQGKYGTQQEMDMISRTLWGLFILEK